MQIDEFIGRIRQGKRVRFEDSLSLITEHFHYHPSRFSNGLGDDRLVNEAGQNEGSCKIFAFGQQQDLSEAETLALFGDHYWIDVLENPAATGHANIRTFMKYGWSGIKFVSPALIPRN